MIISLDLYVLVYNNTPSVGGPGLGLPDDGVSPCLASGRCGFPRGVRDCSLTFGFCPVASSGVARVELARFARQPGNLKNFIFRCGLVRFGALGSARSRMEMVFSFLKSLLFRVIRDHSSRKRKLIFGITILWRTWVVNFVVKNGFRFAFVTFCPFLPFSKPGDKR